MAVASGAPMKMGNVRLAPLRSCSRTTGVFDWRSTLTAASCISTMPETLPFVEGQPVRSCVGPEGLQIPRHDVVEVAVELPVIEPVAEHKVVGDAEPGEADGRGNDAPHRFVEQRADFEGAGRSPGQLTRDVRQS